MHDQDLEQRRINQRVNPVTSVVYTHDQYGPHVHNDGNETNEEEADEVQEESEIEDEETSVEADDLFADDMVKLFYVYLEKITSIIKQPQSYCLNLSTLVLFSHRLVLMNWITL